MLKDPFVRWAQFARERFEPVSHLLLILLFFMAHSVVAGGVPWTHGVPIFIGTFVFFFKLRLYDEIKDYEVDVEFNPTRPLARGLLKHQDLYRGIVVCIGLELLAFGSQGSAALSAIILAIIYSLLMYKEFFVGPWLRPYLTTYAVVHTAVSSLLSLAIFSAITGLGISSLGRTHYFFALNSWCLFNIFEFGRKTFVISEERERVASYSGIFGRFGSVLLVASMALISGVLLWEMMTPHALELRIFLTIVAGALIALGGLSAFLNEAPYGKIYRMASSIYILLIHAGLLAAFSL